MLTDEQRKAAHKAYNDWLLGGDLDPDEFMFAAGIAYAQTQQAATTAPATPRRTDMPIRVQLSRKKGWRMPPNTVNVARPGKWGNPCVVGKHGSRADCVRWHKFALAGIHVLGMKCDDGEWLTDKLIAYAKMARRNIRYLRGKNLACWCALDQPCHADILLELANRTEGVTC